MALLTYQSYQEAYSGLTPLTITKPTSLAEGDLMIAIILGVSTNTPPAGWTSYKKTSVWIDTYYKIADAVDVAASNFSFTISQAAGGAILRFTNPVTVPFDAVSDNTGSGTAVTTGTITPTNNNSVLLMIQVNNSSTVDVKSCSGYAIATSNPSWTEIKDGFSPGPSGNPFSIAYSSLRGAKTATGTGSATLNGSASWGFQLISLKQHIQTSTISETTTTTETISKTTKRTFTDGVTATEDLSQSISRKWNTTSKPTTTWINKPKN